MCGDDGAALRLASLNMRMFRLGFAPLTLPTCLHSPHVCERPDDGRNQQAAQNDRRNHKYGCGWHCVDQCNPNKKLSQRSGTPNHCNTPIDMAELRPLPPRVEVRNLLLVSTRCEISTEVEHERSWERERHKAGDTKGSREDRLPNQ